MTFLPPICTKFLKEGVFRTEAIQAIRLKIVQLDFLISFPSVTCMGITMAYWVLMPF